MKDFVAELREKNEELESINTQLETYKKRK
jgi:hypothetical protein